MQRRPKPLIPIIVTALLAAIATVLFFFPRFALFPGPPTLWLDFSDIPALLAGIVLGPGYGVAVQLIKNILGLIFRGMGTTMGLGNLMNFVVGIAFIVPYAIAIRRGRKKHGRTTGKTLLLAGMAGMVSIIVVGLGMNMLVTPLFFRIVLGRALDFRATWGIIGASTTLNAINGAILTTVGSIFVYLPLRNVLERHLQGRR